MAVSGLTAALRNNTYPSRNGVVNVNGVRRAFLTLSFGGSDTYAAGGFTIDAEVKRITGFQQFDIVRFDGGGSAAQGAGADGSTGDCEPRFDPTSTSRKVTLYRLGRNNNSGLNNPGTEMVAATALTALTLNCVVVEKSV